MIPFKLGLTLQNSDVMLTVGPIFSNNTFTIVDPEIVGKCVENSEKSQENLISLAFHCLIID